MSHKGMGGHAFVISSPNYNMGTRAKLGLLIERARAKRAVTKFIEPTTCHTCGRKAIYKWDEIGACSEHRGTLSPRNSRYTHV